MCTRGAFASPSCNPLTLCQLQSPVTTEQRSHFTLNYIACHDTPAEMMHSRLPGDAGFGATFAATNLIPPARNLCQSYAVRGAGRVADARWSGRADTRVGEGGRAVRGGRTRGAVRADAWCGAGGGRALRGGRTRGAGRAYARGGAGVRSGWCGRRTRGAGRADAQSLSGAGRTRAAV